MSLISQTDSWFDQTYDQPQKEFYSIERQFREDEYDYKIDLAFPCYRDENGKPWVLPVVRTAEVVLANDNSLSKEYLYSLGYDSFNNAAVTLLLGESSSARVENRAFAVQTISATGAIRVGGEFLTRGLGLTTLYSSEHSVEYSDSTFTRAGFKEYEELHYVNEHTLTLDIQGMLHDLSRAKEKSAVFLQVSGHNPTGYDPSLSEWEQIAEIVAARKLFPFFYIATQGFVTGDVDKDVEAVRIFEKRGLEFFCAQSFSWNFGLYNERVGCLSIVVNNTQKVNAIKSHMLTITRTMYAAPPSHGARIVAFILGDRMLTEQWKDTIAAIAVRLKRMRSYLREELERLGTPGTWHHITDQVGNFCLSGLTEIQVEHMKKQYHIYMLTNGRLNVSGLNPNNVEYVAKAIYETLTVIPPPNYITTSISM